MAVIDLTSITFMVVQDSTNVKEATSESLYISQ